MKSAKAQARKLRRFSGLSSKIKIRLFITLIRPIFEYPIVPLCIMSESNQQKIQQFQNKCLRNATRNSPDDEDLTIEEIHVKYKLDAFNVRLHKLAIKVWNKLSNYNETLVDTSNQENENRETQDHFWWRRVAPYMATDEPEPRYLFRNE